MRAAIRRAALLALLVAGLTAAAPAPAHAAFTDAARNDGNGAAAASEFAPRATDAPSIPGTPRDGVAITASAGTWERQPSAYAYQWRRCDATGAACADIAGATSLTYTPAPADVGGTLRIVVTGSNSGGSTSATSAASAVVEPGVPRATAAPVVSGSATTGSTLSASTGTWSGAATISYAYRWQRCTAPATCADVTGATASTYAVTDADSGHTLRVVVTATNAYGSASQASAETAKVNWQVAHVASTSDGITSRRTTMSVAQPAGVQAGDLLVAFVAATQTTTFSAVTAGWTEALSIHGGAFGVWTRVATATEPTTHTFASSQSAYIAVTLSAYRNADTSPGAVTVASTAPQTTTPVAFPALTTAPGAMAVAGLFNQIATARGTVTHTGYAWREAGYSNDHRGGARTDRVEVVAVDRPSPWPSGTTWSGWGTQATLALRVAPKP